MARPSRTERTNHECFHACTTSARVRQAMREGRERHPVATNRYSASNTASLQTSRYPMPAGGATLLSNWKLSTSRTSIMAWPDHTERTSRNSFHALATSARVQNRNAGGSRAPCCGNEPRQHTSEISNTQDDATMYRIDTPYLPVDNKELVARAIYPGGPLVATRWLGKSFRAMATSTRRRRETSH